MFGYTEQQIAQFGLSYGVGAFMLYMVFIILQLARESRAGRFGTFILLLGLGFGLAQLLFDGGGRGALGGLCGVSLRGVGRGRRFAAGGGLVFCGHDVAT